jgi:hypothetical protein
MRFLGILAVRGFTTVASGFLQELAMLGFVVSVLAVGRNFCVYTIGGLKNFEVARVGAVWIDLALAERDYLVVFAFACFWALVFLYDLDCHRENLRILKLV